MEPGYVRVLSATPMLRFFSIAPLIIALFFSCVPAVNFLVRILGSETIYDEPDQVPIRKVALILGTSHLLENGQPSPWFAARMKTAWQLFTKGKVAWLLVSGDNSLESYNEPRKMREALIRLGIPSNRIVLDYAGFSTLDSVVRAKKVFGLSDFIVVSQDFQNARALFIARYSGISAIACNAPVSVSEFTAWNMDFREAFARFKAFLDIFVFHTQPRFLGNPIPIG